MMLSDTKVARKIFEQTALSKGDVVAERTVDLVIYQLQQSAMFFRERLEEDAVAIERIDDVGELARKSEFLAGQLAKDHKAEIDVDGESLLVYLAAADHIDHLAEIVRAMNLNPEWKEYYDDIARKLNEYANGLRIDPDSSFRFI